MQRTPKFTLNDKAIELANLFSEFLVNSYKLGLFNVIIPSTQTKLN